MRAFTYLLVSWKYTDMNTEMNGMICVHEFISYTFALAVFLANVLAHVLSLE